MNNYGNNLSTMTRAELKALAKSRLRLPGVWFKFALAMLVPILITVVFSLLISTPSFFNQGGMTEPEYLNYIQSTYSTMVGTNALEAFATLYFTTGILFTALDLVRDPDFKFSVSGMLLRLFNSRYFWSVLLIAVLTYIATVIGTILLIVPGILIAFGLSFVKYVLYDARERGDQRDMFGILAEAYRMMRGHKFDLFVLKLSFFWWYMLNLVTAGLAAFWVTPYTYLTEAAFYEQVRLQYAATTGTNDSNDDNSDQF